MKKALRYVAALACLLVCVPAVMAGEAPFQDAAPPPFAGPINVVVIDPGHGGEDSGAVGPTGVAEKNVTLSLALKLAEIVRERLKCTVLLTRTSDVFVPLSERTAFANRNRADIFISVHANAALSRDATGVETFFMSVDATDDQARNVAAFENSVMALGRDQTDVPPDDLRDILIDLVRTESHHESSRLAEMIQSSLLSGAEREDRGVKQAPFVVLTGAAMPSVLVEVGFISNPHEERRLNSGKNQRRIAESIAAGVESFRKIFITGNDYIDYGGTIQEN